MLDSMSSRKAPTNEEAAAKDVRGMPKVLLSQECYTVDIITEQPNLEPTVMESTPIEWMHQRPKARNIDFEFNHQPSESIYFNDQQGQKVTPSENHNFIGCGTYRARVVPMEPDGRCGRHAAVAGLLMSGKIIPEQAVELREEINNRLVRDSWDTSEELQRAIAPTGVRLSVLETDRFSQGFQPTRVLNFGTEIHGPVIHFRLLGNHFDLLVPDEAGWYVVNVPDEVIINFPGMDTSDDDVLNAILGSNEETNPSNVFDVKGNLMGDHGKIGKQTQF